MPVNVRSIVPDYVNDNFIVTLTGPTTTADYLFWYRVWIAGIEYSSSLSLVGSNGVYTRQGTNGPSEKYFIVPTVGTSSFTVPLSYFRIQGFVNYGAYGSILAVDGLSGTAVFTQDIWTPTSPLTVSSLTYNASSKNFEVVLSTETSNITILPFTVLNRAIFSRFGPYFSFSDEITEVRASSQIIIPQGITTFTFRITDVSLIPRTFTISLANQTITTTVAADFTDVIAVPETPVSAPQATTNFPYNYSSHLDRIISALDRLVITDRSIAASLNSLATTSEDIVGNLTTLNSNISINNQINNSISNSQTSIAANHEEIKSFQQAIKNLAEGNGIHTISPLEFISFISSYRYLIEGGDLISETEPLTEKQLDKARKRISDYLRKINDLPKAF